MPPVACHGDPVPRVLLVLSVLATATATACHPARATDPTDPTDPVTSPRSDAAPSSGTEPGPSETSDAAGVEAKQIDGVWVFEHHSPDSMQALHGGVPTIVDGCLLVDGAVVIWHDSTIAEVTRLIAAVKAGESPTVSVGGGGMSVEEGASADDFPSAVTQRCSTTTIWFGGT
ncbi:MAG: hypothetical protein JKY37_12310 [Nannocystaceae bacterium]|nr:hypothetical protein [Nannocystaceae bacterium]